MRHFHDRLVIVLDDYHVLQSASIHESVAYFIKRMPEHIRFLIISRTEPPLPLPQLAARNGLLRLDTVDLNFTMGECKAFYRMMKLDLPAIYIEQLLQRTEGWITGMKLAALSLERGGDYRRLIRTLTGNHRYLADYMFQEVFRLQTDSVQSFLKRTSVLNRFCAPLCELVSGTADCQQMLQQLELSNLFLISLDETRQWYRYHYLFTDFLQRLLRQEEPDLWSELHYRAARWFEEQAYTVEAIEHYLAGNHQLQAVRLIEEVLPEVIGGRWETLHRWLSAMPEELLEERPDLYFTLVFFITIKEDWRSVQPKIAGAERFFESRQPFWSAEEASKYAGYLHLIKSYAAVDHLSDLDAAVAHSREYFRSIPNSVLLHHVDIDTGDISILRAFTGIQGKLRRAETFFAEMIEIWQHTFSPFTGIFYIGLGEVMYEWNRIEEAEKAAWRGYEIGKQQNSGKVIAPAAVLLSKIYAIRYSTDQAIAFLQKTIDLLQNSQFHFWADIGEAQILRFRLDRMSTAERQAWWEQWSWILDEEIPSAHLFQALSLIRVLIALEQWDEAAYWLAHLQRLAEQQGRLGEQIEILMLYGLLNKKRKQMKQAVSIMSEALSLAEPDGYLRTFLDEGGAVAELLQICVHDKKENRLPAAHAAPSLGYLAHLNETFRNEFLAAACSLGIAGIELLTDKEREVLHLLAEGVSNRQIAQHMHISVGTVKTHLHRIYDKLQVKGRWEAIEQVRRAWTAGNK
ncbi:LuxR C-terminal-related transcriptional regulator [Brevibacillus humidisoli]|uniref:LuxR C-terminal-related transcriptional regulator n=1 Tax=Brevibacillus humidisoli TaxID=2895522 RepID=UPI001E2F581B|nr:LuxR C-terminal-related transcriptional regulator [Brevibacillus humidisoli]UFJ40327.1 LuxR C-terminal-related transcriptional regulator [Brevibacillus humidisoli]